MTRKERLANWAANLTEDQAKKALVKMVEYAIDGEYISFWDDSLAPYYSDCGEELVDGEGCDKSI